MTYNIHNVFDHGIKTTRTVKLYSFGRIDQSDECIVQTVDNLIGVGFLIFLFKLVLQESMQTQCQETN